MCYFGVALDPPQREQAVKKVVQKIKDSKIEFSSIAYRGNSGAAMAPIIAHLLKKHLIVVRKDRNEEPSHGTDVETGSTQLPTADYIIIDDFVATGATIRAIVERLHPKRLECKGAFLYRTFGASQKPDIVVTIPVGIEVKVNLICCA